MKSHEITVSKYIFLNNIIYYVTLQKEIRDIMDFRWKKHRKKLVGDKLTICMNKQSRDIIIISYVALDNLTDSKLTYQTLIVRSANRKGRSFVVFYKRVDSRQQNLTTYIRYDIIMIHTKIFTIITCILDAMRRDHNK